jgi:iron complex transport system permease protein
MILRCALALMALALWPACAFAQQAKPQRIVSLNLCTDILLLDLVAPERIQALSVNAVDSLISPIAARARPFKRIHADAEEVLALDPDLVVNAEFTSPATASLLKRIGRRVVEIPMAHDMASVRRSIAMVADVTGEVAKGQTIISDLEARLSRIALGAQTSRPTALIYQINNIASGAGLLEDEGPAARRLPQSRTGAQSRCRGACLPRSHRCASARSACACRPERGIPHGGGRHARTSSHCRRHEEQNDHRSPLAQLDMREPICRGRHRSTFRGAPTHCRVEAAGMRADAQPYVLPGLAVTTFVLALASLAIGPAGLSFDNSEQAWLILSEIRLPRTLLGLLVGAALGMSGAVLQGYLRNPLAEPGIIGISGGAALGAVLAIHTGLTASFAIGLPLGALAGAAGAMVVVLWLAGERGGPITLILSGVAIASLTTALIALVLTLSQNPFATVEIVYWLMGSLSDRSLTHVWLAAPPILIGLVVLSRLGRDLDALTLGEEVAANLGTSLPRLRLMVVAGTALAVGAATAVSGTIGFVGLIVPHILRPLVGHVPSRLLPASALGGAALVLAADLALRVLSPGGGIRLGVLTALIGTPFFVWLVVSTRRELAP